MIHLIFFQMKKRIPIITILLIISCIISTLPQFFLSDTYSEITGQVASIKTFYLFTLSAFTHSPNNLTNHLIGNILVFLFYSMITEIIIGSKRLALISIITFFSTTLINYLHTTSKFLGHGASGIAWGYHIFFIFFLIVLFEHRGNHLLKDKYIIFALFLFIFDIIGIPILEVIIFGYGFFDNFGQVLHLVSMFTVVPFIFFWRKDIETNLKKLIFKEEIFRPTIYYDFPIIIFLLLILLNTYGTYKVINLTISNNFNFSYHIIPEVNSNIVDIPKKIIINFDNEIKSSQKILTSISSDERFGKIEVNEKWENSKTLFINFNRRFSEMDKIKFSYLITNEIEDGLLVRNKLILEY